MKAVLLFTLLLAFSTANPGLQAALNVADVNQILMIAYAFGLTTATFDLGSFSLSQNVSPLGLVVANLTDIKITSISVDYASSVFSFQSPNLLTYTVNDLTVAATAAYSISVGGFALTPGQMNITLSNTNATVGVTVNAENGQPQLTVNSFEFQMGDVDVETPLPAEFNNMINEAIQMEVGPLAKLIPGLLAQYVPMVNTMLAGLNLKIAVPGTNVDIDLSLTSSPQILDDEILVIGFDGTVYQNGKAVVAGSPVNVPAQGALSEGVQIAVTDYVVNSLLIPLWPYVNYSISTLPEFMDTELTTDTLAPFLPELQQTFGKGLPVMLNIRSNGPITYSTNGNINVQAHALVDIRVRTGLFHWVLGATFAVKADATLSASVQNNVASAKIQSFSLPSISVVHSFIGTITIDVLKPTLDLAIKLFIPKLNKQLESIPIPLPMGIGSFIQTDDVVVKTGYVLAGLEL